MFARGLGELPMMRHKDNRVMLGNLVMDKGELVFKDRGFLTGVAPARVAPCWDIGIVGAVCDIRGNEWDSLTLLGPDHCHIPVNLSTTRHGLLRSIVNATGENLILYKGSVYRGFKLMLDSHLLPVVLPLTIETREGMTGLAVCDFRFASAPFDMVLKVNDLVRTSVERHLSLTVEDFEVSDDEFAKLFPGHINKEQ
jgi:hypothetical protein